MAEEIVASGKADMVAMTRTQIADPEFANKAREGREDEIYHCIRGNQGCIGRVFKGMAISCTVNPAAGREARFGIGTLTPAESPARWLVVGGGPAGMKAAETFAKRGHRVTLIEREAELGGQINLILRTPGRETFGWMTKDLDRHMRKAGVEILLGRSGDGRDGRRGWSRRRRRRDRSRALAHRLLDRQPARRRAAGRGPGPRRARLGRPHRGRGRSASASSSSTTTAAGTRRACARCCSTAAARSKW